MAPDLAPAPTKSCGPERSDSGSPALASTKRNVESGGDPIS